MDQSNGKPAQPAVEAEEGQRLDLHDHVTLTLEDGSERKFEVVGVLEDDDDNGYAVAYDETNDEYIVTDDFGNLLDDDELAQEILDNYQDFNEEAQSSEAPAPPQEQA